MLRTIFTSIALSALLGPLIVILEGFIHNFFINGVAEPAIIILYPLALIYGASVATPLAIVYALILHVFLSWKKLESFTENTARSCILGAFIGLAVAVAVTGHAAYQSQLEANERYIGNLAAFKPKQVFLKEFISDKYIFVLIIPSLLCGALIPSLLPRPNKSLKPTPPQGGTA